MNNYEKNMLTIERLVPGVAAWIKEGEPVDWAKRIKSESGGDNILVKAENGKKLPIYNMKTPLKQLKENMKHYQLHRNNVSVVIGLGCGYLPKMLLKAKDKKHKVLVIEPVTDFYKVAFEQFDYSKYILNGEILFLTNIDDVMWALQKTEEGGMIEEWYINVDSYTRVRPEYKKITELTMKTVASLRVNTGTVEGAGGLIAENDIKSLPYIVRKRGVTELIGLFAGKPAICVSTGPSLEKNIHLLMDPEVRSKFVILSVGQALRVLLAYDIVPDLATSVDFGIVNYSHYRGLLDCGVPLVALNRSYSKLLQNWAGPLFVSVSDSEGYEGSITGLIQSKGSLIQGGSVAHMNLGLAAAMGCDPIVIIGQDLAWEGEKTHIKQVDEMGTVKRGEDGSIGWDVDDPNTVIPGKAQRMGADIKVMGYYGHLVSTNIGLLSFIESFKRIVPIVKAKIINATEGGAKIEGMKQMSLEEAIDKYSGEAIDKSVLQPLLSETTDADDIESEALSLLESDIANMKQIIKHCDESLLACDKLSKKKSKRKYLLDWMAHNEKHSNLAHELSKKNALIMLAIFKTSRDITHRSLTPQADAKHLAQKDSSKDLKTRVKRNRQIITAARNACEKFIPLYEKSFKQVKQRVEPPAAEPIPDLSKAHEYFHKGNWAWPLLAARKVQTGPMDAVIMAEALNVVNEAEHMRKRTIMAAVEAYDEDTGAELVRFNELVEKASTVGREDKNFELALEYLEKAHEIKPDVDSVIWGLASVNHMLSHYETSLKYYDTLIDRNKDNYQYRFERATVNMAANNVKESLDEFGVVMGNSDNYNHFYRPLSMICLEAGLADEALTSINAYLEHYKADPEGWNVKARVLESLGRIEESEKAKARAGKITAV
jgi:hypothetical protein